LHFFTEGRLRPTRRPIISSSKEEICRSLLLLSKMNWNNTQMDEVFPITLRAAHQVGTILKHIPEDGRIEPHYKFYM